jgi:hypothetical protein
VQLACGNIIHLNKSSSSSSGSSERRKVTGTLACCLSSCTWTSASNSTAWRSRHTSSHLLQLLPQPRTPPPTHQSVYRDVSWHECCAESSSHISSYPIAVTPPQAYLARPPPPLPGTHYCITPPQSTPPGPHQSMYRDISPHEWRMAQQPHVLLHTCCWVSKGAHD